EGGGRTEQVGRRGEFQSGIALRKRNKVAVVDRGHTVVLEQRAVGDAGDLEVGYFSAVGSVPADDQTRCALRVFIGRRGRDRRRVGNRVDGDRGRGHAGTQTSAAGAGGALDLEGESRSRAKQVGRRGELQSCIAFGEGNEVTVIDLGRAVVLKQRAV